MVSKIRFIVIAGLIVLSLWMFLNNSSGDELNRGMAIYQAHCLSCHGPLGNGQGPEAASLDPKPTDFTNKTIMNALTPEKMEKAIVEGIPDTSMKGFGSILSPEDVRDVILYIRSLSK